MKEQFLHWFSFFTYKEADSKLDLVLQKEYKIKFRGPQEEDY
jgi:hypothetical protein